MSRQLGGRPTAPGRSPAGPTWVLVALATVVFAAILFASRVPSTDVDERTTSDDLDVEVMASRVNEGLVALYDFAEPSDVVTDVAGIHPGFDLVLDDPSAVSWTDGGLRFEQHAIAATEEAPSAFYEAVAASDEFTVEAWVTPASSAQEGPARIVTLSRDPTHANLLVGQGKHQDPSGAVEVRLHEREGDFGLRTSAAPLGVEPTHVVMTRVHDGDVRVHVDGELVAEGAMASSLDGWDRSYRLAIANELDGSRPWLGTYHLVALYSTALSADAVQRNYAAGPPPRAVDDAPPAADVSPVPETDEYGPSELPWPVEGGPTPTTMRSSVAERDITVTFDEQYPVGEFVNGDLFVVGEPTVVALSPAWDGTRHGAMLNPSTGDPHGYHAGLNGWEPTLNVAAQLPLELQPGDALIATVGWDVADPEAPDAPSSTPEAPRPALKQAMVLTVLDEPPPQGTFRPPFSAQWRPNFHVSELDLNRLPRLAAPDTPPADWTTQEERTRYVWLDHKPQWTGRYIHPSDNMRDYGRDLAAEVNEAILALMLDEDPLEQRRTLIHVVQIGIDTGGVVRDVATRENGYYGDFGGSHGIGRKWPVLLAAAMLESEELYELTQLGPRYWGEDGQTYWSEGGEADPWRSRGEGTWGERAHTRPVSFDNGRPGNRSYRSCCTAAAWHSAVLGARLMGLEDEWGHPPLFDYTQWRMEVDTVSGVDEDRSVPQGSTGGFLEEMWDLHWRESDDR